MIQIDTNSPETGQAASQGLRNSRTEENDEDSIEFSQVWSEFIEPDAQKVAPPRVEEPLNVTQSVSASSEGSPDVETAEVRQKPHPVETRLVERKETQSAQPSHEASQAFPANVQSDPRARGLSAAALPIVKASDSSTPLPTSRKAPEGIIVPLQTNSSPSPSVVVSPHVSGDGKTSEQLQRQLLTGPTQMQAVARDQVSKARLPVEGAKNQAEQVSDLSGKPTVQMSLSAATQVPVQAAAQKQSASLSLTLLPQEQPPEPQSVAKPTPLILSKTPSSAIPPLPITEPSILNSQGAPEIELPAFQPLHIKGSNVSSTLTPSSQPNAPQVAAQIVAAISQSSGATTEIILNPEELGRVRISLTNGDTGMTVNILAERAETTDLMRRNIEFLARELRDMGYENPNFTFGEGSDGSSEAWDDEQSESAPENPSNASEPLTPNMQVTLTGGLDLKL